MFKNICFLFLQIFVFGNENQLKISVGFSEVLICPCFAFKIGHPRQYSVLLKIFHQGTFSVRTIKSSFYFYIFLKEAFKWQRHIIEISFLF